ncbi:hypothetical protein C8J56DRAFT_544059 [Mycena floridula]|nr:hypothetical protein C8J56DRAFT_544059 [Mycena floridula]
MEVLRYLGLEEDYQPSPSTEPIEFLSRHLRILPQNQLLFFSTITTPQQRTTIPTIRNRRLTWAKEADALSFTSARRTWPTLWKGPSGRFAEEDARNDERDWVDRSFFKHVGKLGQLLGDYEEEREAERIRAQRREHAAASFVPEEDDSDSEEEDDADEEPDSSLAEPESESEMKVQFERAIQERFIYGLLSNIDYDSVDWDDSLDSENDRDEEEKWFDEEEEG